MRYEVSDKVQVISTITVEIGDETVKLRAGARLEILAVRGRDVKVLDAPSFVPVWIPDRLVRRV